MSEEQTIRVGELSEPDAPAADIELPVVQVLTGRGFVTGKSGSGKSNTASVVAEELLDAGYPLLIVDTDGEYYGLKEEYELLHVGADDECDIQISSEHADRVATLALEENVPIILDVSGYLDEDEANELIRETARRLFAKEKKLKKPFLLVVEEVHEYIPEGGGLDETGKMLIKIGKRGRKHGLGIVGISQRPADVKKDFITQANWLVWHRLTWENDTKVVGRIVGGEYGDRVSDLDDGQAFVQTDWTEADVQRVQFRRKHTFDAGATPGLEDFERPELKSVSDDLMGDLQEITQRREQKQDRVKELEMEVQKREDRIAQLESKLDSAQDVSQAARQMADALSETSPTTPEEVRERIAEKEETIAEMEAAIDEREATIETLRERVEELEGERDQLSARVEQLETILDEREERIRQLETARDQATLDEAVPQAEADGDAPALTDLLDAEPVRERVALARRDSLCNETHATNVLAALADGEPADVREIADSVDATVPQIQSLLTELRRNALVARADDGTYTFRRDVVAAIAEGRSPEAVDESLGDLKLG